MGYYALIYHVVDQFVERRAPFRELHLAHAQRAAEQSGLVLAGALAEPADSALIIFRGDSPDAARSFAKHDPYVRNGLVAGWEVRPWNVVIGEYAELATASSKGGA
ncbi:MAG TPA: YciI-like protein [Candidatus Eisenbacteria bacterium]|nr:YciI-like protein [Candidatus Eisenbacteria bacterium]